MSGTGDKKIDFLQILIRRGLGIYGREKITQICQESNIRLLSDDSIEWLVEDRDKSLQTLILNYSQLNLPAKMTAMVLAKRFAIPIPEEFKARKKVPKTQSLLKK